MTAPSRFFCGSAPSGAASPFGLSFCSYFQEIVQLYRREVLGGGQQRGKGAVRHGRILGGDVLRDGLGHLVE